MSGTILLVHDDIAAIATLRRLLTRAGNEVVLATSAADALIAYGAHLPALVILSPGVEGGRGQLVLDELAQHPQGARARVMLLGQQIDDYVAPVVPLPLEGSTFLEMVERALEGGEEWRVFERRAGTPPPTAIPDGEGWRATAPPQVGENPGAASFDLPPEADWQLAAPEEVTRQLHAPAPEIADEEKTSLEIHAPDAVDATDPHLRVPSGPDASDEQAVALTKKIRFEEARTKRALELLEHAQERLENAEQTNAELKAALDQARAHEQAVGLERNAFKAQLEALNRSSSGWRTHAEEVEADRGRLRARLVAAEEARAKLQEALDQALAAKGAPGKAVPSEPLKRAEPVDPEAARSEAERSAGASEPSNAIAELTARAETAEQELARREAELTERAEAAEQELARREAELTERAEAAEQELARREAELIERAEAAEAELARRKAERSAGAPEAAEPSTALAELTARAEAAERELEQVRKEKLELSARSEAAEAELEWQEKRLSARAEAAEAEEKRLKKAQEEETARADAAEAELARREAELLARAEAAEAELDQAHAEKARLEKELAALSTGKQTAAREAIAELTERAEKAEAERDAASQRLAEAEAAAAKLSAQVEAAQADGHSASTRLVEAEAAAAELERQLAEATTRAEQAEAEREAASQRLAEAEAAAAKLTAQIEAAQVDGDSASRRLFESEAARSELGARAESAEAERDAASQRMAQAQAVLGDLKRKLAELLARAEKLDAERGSALQRLADAELLADGLEQQVASLQARAELAEAKRDGTAQRLAESEALVAGLEKQLSKHASRADAAEAKRDGSAQRLVAAEALTTGLEQQVAALTARAEAAEAEREGTAQRLAEAEARAAGLEQERSEQTARAEAAEAEREATAQRLTKAEALAEARAQELAEQAARAKAELGAAVSRADQLTAEANALREELAATKGTLEAERREAAEQVGKLEAGLIAQRDEAARLSTSVAEWQSHAEKLDTERNVLAHRGAAAEQQRAEAAGALEQTTAELLRVRQVLQATELKLAEAQARAMKLDGALSARRQEWQAELLLVRRRVEELEAALADAQKQRAATEAELAAANEAIRAEGEAKAQLEAARAKAAEEAEQAQAETRRLALELESAVVPLLGPQHENWSVATSGTLGLVPLAKLVRRLGLAQAEVRLELKAAGAMRVLWLRGGRLVAAASDRDEESLIERARRDGLIDVRQARELRLLRAASEPELLTAMRERGLLREAEVVPLCQRHVEQLALEALSEPETVYRIGKALPPSGGLSVQALRGLPSLIGEALRRGLKAIEVTAELLRSVPSLRGPEEALVEAGFSEKERALLLAADGKATVQALLLGAGLRAQPGLRTFELARALELLELTPPSPDEILELPADLEVQRLAAKYDTSLDADYFSVLGLQRSAGAAEVERAYQSLSEEFHPLRFAGHPDTRLRIKAEALQALFTEAAQALGDERLRAEYARNLAE